jgi:hypothetical protein
MSFIPIGRRPVLAALFVFALSLSARSDELADFHAAVEQASSDYRVAMTTLETKGQEETAAAVQQLRHSWQAINERFVKHPPAPFADDEKFATMFMLVDVQLVGVLLVVEMGNRNAARDGLAPIEETLSRLSARSVPVLR